MLQLSGRMSPAYGCYFKQVQPSYTFKYKHMMTIGSIDYTCNGDNGDACHSPTSDEDNSPSEWNKCKRLVDKPPLVKRLTMGFLRSHEESKPLMTIGTTVVEEAKLPEQPPLYSNCRTKSNVEFNSYVLDHAILKHNDHIASKFGDSCRQSWRTIPTLNSQNIHDRNEFTLKKKYLRETSSANSSPKIYANRLYRNKFHLVQKNIDNVNNRDGDLQNIEEMELRQVSWFQAGISRDIAEEILSTKVPGSFVVRESKSRPGCYALTVRIPSPPGPKTANYIILHTIQGYKIKGFHKEFKSLHALITHHSVMPELLPVPLAVPRPTNIYSSRRLDDFDTYDSLKSFFKYLRRTNLEDD